MTTLLRLPTPPALRFAFVAAVVAAAACGNRSIIGDQNGGSGGHGGSSGDAGTSGAAGTWGFETAGVGWGGTVGSAGTWGFETAGTIGTAGTVGSAGNSGTVGGANGSNCSQQPGGSGGSVLAFTSAAQYPTYRSPGWLALGDLDGDGKLDFAATNTYATDQRSLGGSSGAAGWDGVGGNPGSAGVNGGAGTSGRISPGSVSVFLSGENHAAPHNYAAGLGPFSLAIGDLNGDGKADLAAVNERDLTVHFNSGGGSLSPPVAFSTGTNPAWVALGDLNGDGKNDIVVANRGMYLDFQAGIVVGADVAVFLNMGSGTFVAANYPAGTSPTQVALGDLNGDGKPDIVAPSGTSVSVVLNTGSGSFGPPASYGAGTKPSFVAVGDLNGDAKPDIALSNTSIGGSSVLLNIGNGTFAAAVNYGDAYGYPYVMVMGDLNGDGKADLAHSSSECGIAVLLNAGNGTFAAPVGLYAGLNAGVQALGDLNGDGKLDIFVTGPDAVGVLQNLR